VDVEENSVSAPRPEAGSTRPVIDTISTDDEPICRLIAPLEEPRPLGAADEAARRATTSSGRCAGPGEALA